MAKNAAILGTLEAAASPVAGIFLTTSKSLQQSRNCSGNGARKPMLPEDLASANHLALRPLSFYLPRGPRQRPHPITSRTTFDSARHPHPSLLLPAPSSLLPAPSGKLHPFHLLPAGPSTALLPHKYRAIGPHPRRSTGANSSPPPHVLTRLYDPTLFPVPPPCAIWVHPPPSAGLGSPPPSHRLGSPTPLPSTKPGSPPPPPPSHRLGSPTPPIRTTPASPPPIEPSSPPPIDLLGPSPPIDLLGPSPPALDSLAFPPCLVGSPSATNSYPRDRLDEHITQAISVYRHSASWGDFIRTIRGRGDIHPNVGTIPHPAGPLLAHLGHEGTPASMNTLPWNTARLAGALARGPHQSSRQGIAFLREEYADMMDKQQWTVLPASLILNLPNLRLSPLGLVPQRGRRPRMISDYTYSEVNQDTIPLAPAEAMQFGRTLPRLLHKLHHANNRFGPVYMSKIDLADGFYRVRLHPEDTMNLGVLFLARPGEPPLVGIPLTNPMGPGQCHPLRRAGRSQDHTPSPGSPL
eukprot:jgi/Psemu1/53700/gm1.53700_g